MYQKGRMHRDKVEKSNDVTRNGTQLLTNVTKEEKGVSYRFFSGTKLRCCNGPN